MREVHVDEKNTASGGLAHWNTRGAPASKMKEKSTSCHIPKSGHGVVGSRLVAVSAVMVKRSQRG